MKPSRIVLNTLGCKLNQAETELMAKQLAEAGYKLVSPSDKADVYILNTCTVTHIADRKSRHLLRMAHRQNPEACVVVTGCYAQRSPEELARVEGVDLVLSNEKKPYLLQILEESGRLVRPSTQPAGIAFRTRAFIKAQDGCSNFCAYCIVPLVRGSEKSLPAEQVIDEIRQRVAAGYREVVLTGTEIGSYSYNGINLKGLLARILAEAGVSRLRLSSIQPQEASPELISLWQDPRLCRHFHLSLQSGSDSVLRRMGRRYTTADYQQAVSLIRSQVPDVAITTDVIVGFPGETEEEFQQSYDFSKQMAFARIHVFSYSPRPGTKAATMPGQVPAPVKKQRSESMLALAKTSAQSFIRGFSGKTLPVLLEQQSGGVWSGYTDNYIKVYVKTPADLTNQLLPVKLGKVRGDGVWGEVIP